MGKRLEDLKLDPRREFHGKYRTARGRLAAFLTDLDPLFRRLLTGDRLSPFDNINSLSFDTGRRRQLDRSRREYFKLLKQVVDEGFPRKLEGVVNGEFIDNARREAILYESPDDVGGRPYKGHEDHLSVVISLEADRCLERFEPGFSRIRALRKSGTFDSDPDEIKKIVARLPQRYNAGEIASMIASKSCRAAVARYLAQPLQFNMPFDRLQAEISRGRKRRSLVSAQRRRVL